MIRWSGCLCGGRFRAVPGGTGGGAGALGPGEGRPATFTMVLMFKVLVLKTPYTLSDDATEHQLRDRLSFMRFCGLAVVSERKH